MSQNLLICAVIVTYEPSNTLFRLFDSIKSQVDNVIVVDNNSISTRSKQILKSLENQTVIIYNKSNLGVAAAFNHGVKYAVDNGYKWVLTLDQDSEFFQNTYQLLLSGYEQLKNKDKVMLIAPSPLERINFTNNIKSLPHSIIWKDSILNLTSGSLIKAEAFNLIGLFDEKLFIEQVDNDFCYRLIKKGYKIKIAENINFIQEIGNAVKVIGFIVRNHQPKRKYYLSRNVTIMLKRYFFVAPYITIRYFLGGTIFGWMKILLFEAGKTAKIKAGFEGFADGLFNKFKEQ